MESETRPRRRLVRAPSAPAAPTQREVSPHRETPPDDVLNGSEVKTGLKPQLTGNRHWSGLPLFVGSVSKLIGVVVLIAVSIAHAVYMRTIHENDLWFSNVKEVEREISFRTESGLYYSYYKQLINAPSLKQGIEDLKKDNMTEHGRTINVLARMNIYQEVVLAATYRSVPLLQTWFQPIIFYINAIFALHGLLVGALYTITWLLSGSWLAGLLTAAFYIFNHDDTTRVNFTIPLRESFALPFLWCQLAFLTVYFKPQCKSQTLSLIGVAMCTFLFSITWQFNQFILLLQAMALFAVQVLGFVPLNKIRKVYIIQIMSLVAVSVLQFGNPMITSGPCICFMEAAVAVLHIQRRVRTEGVIRSSLVVSGYIVLVFLLTAGINIGIKMVTNEVGDDEHIHKFVLTKLGFYAEQSQRDFDVRLYLCNGAFGFISKDVFERLTWNLVFPIYAYVHAVMVAILVIAFLQRTSNKSSRMKAEKEDGHFFADRPDLAFHVIQTVFFGIMAVLTLRMKYLWTPYMCILAVVGISDKAVTEWLLERCSVSSAKAVAAVRHCLTIAVLGWFLYLVVPKALNELSDLREFYDPETVDLMNWIKEHTPQTAAFMGSMQLLAGVKLCTGRPITNHPHYEDKHLRHRTKELYQVYGRHSAADVHLILLPYNVSYIILEDSICMAPSKNNCRLLDIIDIDNGVIPDNGLRLKGLVKSKVARFCNKIRHSGDEFNKYFKPAFTNKVFRVYEVLHHTSINDNDIVNDTKDAPSKV